MTKIDLSKKNQKYLQKELSKNSEFKGTCECNIDEKIYNTKSLDTLYEYYRVYNQHYRLMFMIQFLNKQVITLHIVPPHFEYEKLVTQTIDIVKNKLPNPATAVHKEKNE